MMDVGKIPHYILKITPTVHLERCLMFLPGDESAYPDDGQSDPGVGKY